VRAIFTTGKLSEKAAPVKGERAIQLSKGKDVMSLDGKTAVITGTSHGIGGALAHLLHERGVNLVLAARSGDDWASRRRSAR
jgi:5,10-methylene-tetrahydrofolate dehydrogenase/methenyl tetrahydrofolate cyclohydrolase